MALRKRESNEREVTMINVDADRLIETIDDAEEILYVLNVDLGTIAFERQAVSSQPSLPLEHVSCVWNFGNDDRLVSIIGRQMELTDRYAVRWTVTNDEIDNVEIVGIGTANSLAKWLRKLADHCAKQFNALNSLVDCFD